MTESVAYLDPLQGGSNKEQKARIRQRFLTELTAPWWTHTKHNASATEDIKNMSQRCVIAMPAAPKDGCWHHSQQLMAISCIYNLAPSFIKKIHLNIMIQYFSGLICYCF